jgi:CIC family chloride channel protein
MLKVGDLMKPLKDFVSAEAAFDVVARAFLQSRHDFLPVVENGGFIGIISLHDIKPYLDQPELESLLIAKDVVREDSAWLDENQTMDEALHIFARAESERLPVLNSRSELVGTVTKSDVLLFLAGIPKTSEVETLAAL